MANDWSQRNPPSGESESKEDKRKRLGQAILDAASYDPLAEKDRSSLAQAIIRSGNFREFEGADRDGELLDILRSSDSDEKLGINKRDQVTANAGASDDFNPTPQEVYLSPRKHTDGINFDFETHNANFGFIAFANEAKKLSEGKPVKLGNMRNFLDNGMRPILRILETSFEDKRSSIVTHAANTVTESNIDQAVPYLLGSDKTNVSFDPEGILKKSWNDTHPTYENSTPDAPGLNREEAARDFLVSYIRRNETKELDKDAKMLLADLNSIKELVEKTEATLQELAPGRTRPMSD